MLNDVLELKGQIVPARCYFQDRSETRFAVLSQISHSSGLPTSFDYSIGLLLQLVRLSR